MTQCPTGLKTYPLHKTLTSKMTNSKRRENAALDKIWGDYSNKNRVEKKNKGPNEKKILFTKT